MAKSLFGNNKNSDNMADKYRVQNEAALRQERADELDGKISELSNATRNTKWAKDTLALYENVMLNEDIFDLLVNLALIKVLKKEAETFLAKQKELEATELKNKAEAAARAAKQKIDDYEDSIVALSKAAKTERWCKDVESLAAEINALPIKERAKIRSTELLEELEGEIALVRKAAEVSKAISAHCAKPKQDKAWANAALDIDAGIALNVKQYIKNAGELKEMVSKARDIIDTVNKQEKEAKAARDAANKAEKERLAELERQHQAELNAEIQRLRSKVSATKVGKTVTFGSYIQNGSSPEPIEWILLWKNGPMAVLLSKNILDSHEYNDLTELYKERNKYVETAGCGPDLSNKLRWDTCSLRAWLNGEFYNTCFTEAEKSIITNSYTTSKYGRTLTVTTYDKVVVPSHQEMDGKFFKKKYMKAKLTSFAIRRGAGGKKKIGYWWTRDTYLGVKNYCDLYSVNFVDTKGILNSNPHVSSAMSSENAAKANYIAKTVGVRPLIEVAME